MMPPNMYETLLIAQLISQTLVLCIISWGAWQYIRLRGQLGMFGRLIRRIMNSDELLDQLLEKAEPVDVQPPVLTRAPVEPNADTQRRKRDRLAALVAGGQARQYLGKNLSTDQIDEMSEDEVDRIYSRYEARLGATMTKTLGQSFLQLYAIAAGTVLPIPKENQPKLITDLEEDPFVSNALNSATCELYHRYGMFLAPLTAVLTTYRHCQFEQKSVVPMISDLTEQNNGEPARGTTVGGESYGGASNAAGAGE